MSHSFKDLFVWQKARRLAIETYRLTASFPKSETYGLAAQLRRCSVSVVSNIAEGQGRLTTGEFVQFLGVARGSLLELRTQFDIAHELAYLSDEEFAFIDSLAVSVMGLIGKLIDSLPRAGAKTRIAPTSKPRNLETSKPSR